MYVIRKYLNDVIVNRLFFLEMLYKNQDSINERHRHRYEVNPELVHLFEEQGFKFVGHDVEKVRMEAIELKGK